MATLARTPVRREALGVAMSCLAFGLPAAEGMATLGNCP
jgi:hypothetical protein